MEKPHYISHIVLIAKINYIFLVAIKFYLLVQFKSKVLIVKSNLLITDDLPITIKSRKHNMYDTKT